jgi:hypothetical protein
VKANTWVILALLLTGCIHIPTTAERTQHATSIAEQAGWHQQIISAGSFDLAIFKSSRPIKSDTLIIYIAGDGLAWINRSTPSLDPTPIHPVALDLALHESETAVYLARPCQYVMGKHRRNCSLKYWTSHRFAPEVIQAENNAVEHIKQQFGASQIILVGYSGGGAVAALIAARRNDVVHLVTIAGNLDTAAWTHLHRISPLTGSFNPADSWKSLEKIPQTHYVGQQDRIVPPSVVQSYAAYFPQEFRPIIKLVPNFDHHCCWVKSWRGVNKELGK